MAGAEKSGAEAARPDLFRDRRVILTPLPENADSAVKKVQAAWSACGARVSTLDTEEHDAILGAVSHLPHVLAYALVHEIAIACTPDEAPSLRFIPPVNWNPPKVDWL